MTFPSLPMTLLDPSRASPSRPAFPGGLAFPLHLRPGIYRVRAEMDAARFDWERLYLPMQRFGNRGQRTGPWDFELEKFRPLLPAYWVFLDGQRLGLWVMRRPSPQDIAERKMAGAFCFEVGGIAALLRNAESGNPRFAEARLHPVKLELRPYNAFDIVFLSLTLDHERDDVPRPVELSRPLPEASLAAYQARHQVWNDWQAKLQTTHRAYAGVVDKAIAFAKQNAASAELLPLLAFAWKARADREAREAVLASVGHFLEQPHWGNPAEDGYGHDMDMGVAEILEALAILYHWMGDDLGEWRPRLREKLRLQMQRFYTAMLLWTEYWGGSLAQDHGRRSVSRFGVAALHLLGVLPEAEHWLGFVAQRMERSVAVMPTDGGIPFASYHKLHLYVDDLLSWRDALLHATGRDGFDNEVFQKIAGFVVSRLHEPTMQVLCASPRGDRKDFYAGWGFLNAIAQKFGDRRAARLTELLLRMYEIRPMLQRPAATVLQALMHHAPHVVPAAALDPPPFVYLPDSGLVHYRDDRREVAVSILCTPPGGSRSACARLRCSCDRILDAPLAGHFTVAVKDQTMLLTAEGGYRMRASLGNVLLVDGRGGIGDADYPMSIPNVSYRGERIEEARFDATTGEGVIRMELTPAYPEEMGLVSYQREVLIRPGGLLCRDRVVAAKEHEYSWHFQTYTRRQVERIAVAAYRITDGSASLTLRGRCAEAPLLAAVAPTEVVWAYENENDSQEFQHVEFKTSRCLSHMTAEFQIEWGDG